MADDPVREDTPQIIAGVLDAALEACVCVDADGRIVAFNQAAETLFGFTREAVLGAPLVERLIPAARRDAYRRMLDRAFSAVGVRRQGRSLSLVAAHRSGDERSVDLAITRIPGEPAHWAVFLRDRTATDRADRRQAAQYHIASILAQADALDAAAEDVLKTLCTMLPCQFAALWTIHGDRMRCASIFSATTSSSTAFEEVTRGLALQEGTGLAGEVWRTQAATWFDDLSSDRGFVRVAAAARLGLRSAVAFPVSVRGELLGVLELLSESALSRDEGLHPLFASIGNQVGLFIKRMQAEEARAQSLRLEQAARADAEQSSRAKDEFLAMLTHELRTPLNAILGWAHLLETGAAEGEKSVHAVDAITRNARAQSRLIDDLLDVSRIIAGKFRLELDRVQPDLVIRAAVDAIQPAASAKHLSIDLALDARGLTVDGDAQRLQQVVWNLLVNAVKFTPRNGQVWVTSRQVDQHIETVVRDNGQGISPLVLPHVFERFRQGDTKSTPTHTGLGLGLAIVRHIVELHGGSVRAESAGEGQGATLRVSIPIRAAAAGGATETVPPVEAVAASEAPAVGRPVASELAGLRVLVVEDDAESREMMGYFLKLRGADVLLASSAKQALATLDHVLPDVILSDIEMPEEDGYHLLRMVRARPAAQGGRVPAAAVTAYAGPEDRDRSKRAGFEAHLAKPVNLTELVATIGALARRG